MVMLKNKPLLINVCIPGLLIYGVKQEDEKLLLPALVLWPVDVIIRLVFVIILNIGVGVSNSLVMGINITFLCGLIANVLIWLCVYSHWSQLKDSGGPQSGRRDEV